MGWKRWGHVNKQYLAQGRIRDAMEREREREPKRGERACKNVSWIKSGVRNSVVCDLIEKTEARGGQAGAADRELGRSSKLRDTPGNLCGASAGHQVLAQVKRAPEPRH